MDAKLTHNKAVTAAQAELIKREQTPMRNDFQESVNYKQQESPTESKEDHRSLRCALGVADHLHEANSSVQQKVSCATSVAEKDTSS